MADVCLYLLGAPELEEKLLDRLLMTPVIATFTSQHAATQPNSILANRCWGVAGRCWFRCCLMSAMRRRCWPIYSRYLRVQGCAIGCARYWPKGS